MLQRSKVRGHRAVVLAAVSRPWFWPVSWVPAYMGLVTATGAWLPPPEDRTRALLALAALGPLIWGAVLAQNDLHDLPTDRLNPRKATAPLVTGAISARQLGAWAVVFVLASLTTAALIDPLYLLGVAGVLVLGWAYSAPPFRLKSRPGFDVAVNAFVVGVVAPLGGWSVSRSPWDFPWGLAVLTFLFAAAFYLPTTAVDHLADRYAGYRTIAVRLGPRAVHRLGLAVWSFALGLSLIYACLDVVVPASTLGPQLVLVPVLLAAYAGLTWRPSIPRLAVLALLFAVPTAGFAVAVVGGSGF